MSQNALDQARSGNVQAVTHIINRSLEQRGIQATAVLNNGCLEVMLDAASIPPDTIADFIRNGLLKLNIEPVYEAIVYGRKSGEWFAAWSRRFELKARPTHLQTHQVDRPIEDDKAQDWRLILANPAGEVFNLDFVLVLGFLGSVFVLLGVFAPIVNLPVVGTVNFYRNGSADGVALLGLAIAALLCVSSRRYSWLYGPGVWAFLLVGYSFVAMQVRIVEMKSDIDRDLAGNPFRGIADLAMAAVQLQWGWLVLFLGTILILVAAYLKKRNLNKQAIQSIGVTFLGAALLALAPLTSDRIENRDVQTEARQLVAETYIGSINRGQQSQFLEKEQFASSIDELALGIDPETEYYHYQVAVAEDDMTVATATAQQRGLKSYTGAVFLTQTNDGEATVAIVCESNMPRRSAPPTPILASPGKPECLSGSNAP